MRGKEKNHKNSNEDKIDHPQVNYIDNRLVKSNNGRQVTVKYF